MDNTQHFLWLLSLSLLSATGVVSRRPVISDRYRGLLFPLIVPLGFHLICIARLSDSSDLLTIPQDGFSPSPRSCSIRRQTIESCVPTTFRPDSQPLSGSVSPSHIAFYWPPHPVAASAHLKSVRSGRITDWCATQGLSTSREIVIVMIFCFCTARIYAVSFLLVNTFFLCHYDRGKSQIRVS